MFNFPPTYSLFSLKLSSACKVPFMASRTKNMCQRLGNLGAKFSDTSFPHFTTYSTQMSRYYCLRQHFKTFDSSNFTLSSMISFQNVRPIKRKAVDTLVLFHFPCENRTGSQLPFLKSTFFNFSKPSSGCRW